MDGNAWDLVEGGEETSQTHKRSRSPSDMSKIGSEAIFGADIDAEELSHIINEDIRERSQRSKSPAVESIRKVSRAVLEKIGIKPKKKDEVFPLHKASELPEIPLDGICIRPTKPTIYDDHKPSTSNFLPKFVSSALLKDRQKDTAEGKWLVYQ